MVRSSHAVDPKGERSLRRGPCQRPGIMWSTAPLESPWFVDFDGVAPHNRALRIIRQRAKHVKNKPTLRRRRVESFGQAAKTDASHS